MPLVRCTCLSRLEYADGWTKLLIDVPDPDCGYVVHRAVQDVPLEPTA
jgi:hypothetical protein